MILFMDDSPERAAITCQRWPKEKSNKTMWCQTAYEAIEVLENYVDRLEEVHLDHDLGGESFVNSAREDTGMEVVRFLERLPPEKQVKYAKIRFICHSWNIPAGLAMCARLQKLGFKAIARPIGQ